MRYPRVSVTWQQQRIKLHNEVLNRWLNSTRRQDAPDTHCVYATNDWERLLEQSQSAVKLRIIQTSKLVLPCLEFNKPNKQNVYYINLYKNHAVKKQHRNLAFRRECSSPFQGTAASKV